MRRICLSILFLFYSSILFAQNTPVTDEYGSARSVIKDLDLIVSPNGVQENYEVSIGGLKQWAYVRGQNRDNPLILFVHGGPASPMAPIMWMYQRPLEEYFTVVQYDQRASGKTYLANDTAGLASSIHADQYANDAIELTEFIKKKYNKKKVIIIGHSWGTIVAMKAILKRPDLFYAYVGIGQVICTVDNERLSYEYGVKEATLHKNDTALAELKSIAPYPGDQPITRERIIIARKWAQYYGGLAAYRNNYNYYFNAPLLSPEYSKKDIKGIDDGNVFTLGRILPEFLDINFKNVKNFPIPVFMFMGRHDYTTPSEPTHQWLNQVRAPLKKGIWFEHSAHLIPLEEPGKMLVTLLNDVKPLAK